jgi:hypothetical protein
MEAPGVYSALAGGAAQRENTGDRFRDVAGRFLPARREMCAAICLAFEKERELFDVEKCAAERIGLRKLLAQ